MIYTLICKQTNFETDIKVFEHQKIKDTLSILYNEKIIAINPDNPIAIRSERKAEMISKEMTYEQAGIYNGDILYIEQENK
jgi:uncharacterized ubiquitin-like protein YukD